MDIEEPELALQYLNVAFSRNAAWAEAEIGDGIYCALGRDPLLHKWVTQAQEQNALAEYRNLKSSKPNSGGGDVARSRELDLQLKLASRLLEVGHSEEALAILTALLPAVANASAKDGAELYSLLADGYAAQGDLPSAIEHAQAAAKLQPSNVAAGKKTLLLQAELANRR
jgi:tetratricopeptide (TPR) repeat protein